MSEQIYADGIKNVSFANGILRVELYTIRGENEQQDAGTLLLPVNQAHNVANSLSNAVQQLNDRLKKAQQERQGTQGTQGDQPAGAEDSDQLHFGGENN